MWWKLFWSPSHSWQTRARSPWENTCFRHLEKRCFVQRSRLVKNCSKAALLPVIQGKILEGSTIHTDGWKAYDGLLLNGFNHYRVYHSHNEFSRGKSHIHGLESFWSFAKRRLTQFNGVCPKSFYLFIKETEFRFNCRDQNWYQLLLGKLRKYPL